MNIQLYIQNIDKTYTKYLIKKNRISITLLIETENIEQMKIDGNVQWYTPNISTSI